MDVATSTGVRNGSRRRVLARAMGRVLQWMGAFAMLCGVLAAAAPAAAGDVHVAIGLGFPVPVPVTPYPPPVYYAPPAWYGPAYPYPPVTYGPPPGYWPPVGLYPGAPSFWGWRRPLRYDEPDEPRVHGYTLPR